jgi:hypothetical protein
LLYSWTADDTKAVIGKYNVILPEWMRFPAYILGFCGLFYIFSKYIFPMGHIWILIIIGTPSLLAIVVGLLVTAKKPKIRTRHDEGKYLKIYKGEIAINLEHICGNYTNTNIAMDSLAVKYIAHWGYGGVGPVKGLSFTTINPVTEVKVPLFLLLPQHVKNLKQAISILKQQEVIAALKKTHNKSLNQTGANIAPPG